MSFADELRRNSLSQAQAIEDERNNHTVESDFVEHLVELIKENCTREASNHKNCLECIVDRDSDSDYRLLKPPFGNCNGIHTLCYGYFGRHMIKSIDGYEKMHHVEDNQFIVNELRTKLNSMGFLSVEVQLSYAPKQIINYQYKRSFLFGDKKPVKEITFQGNYYKKLYIKLIW